MEEQTAEIRISYKPHMPKGQRALGPLQTEIMEETWDNGGSVTVSKIHKRIQSYREIAYTTVMTTMSRMAEKGLLKQDKSGTQYVYTPVFKNKLAFNDFVSRRLLSAMGEDGLLPDTMPVLAGAHEAGR